MLEKLYALREKYNREVLYAEAKLEVVNDMIKDCEAEEECLDNTETESADYSATDNVI